MGTTLAALQSGSLAYQWVVAIEGFGYLLTDGDAAAAITAWSGSGWTQAISGLFVDVQNESTISPWAPFSNGGTCTLTVLPDASDVLGIATHRSDAGNETELISSTLRTDTVINVKDASAFAASGEIHIGTECIAYTGKTATSFTGCTRGKYSPFGSYAHAHRYGTGQLGEVLAPIVSQYQRAWIGRWVGVWLHAKTGSALNTKAEAQLVFAGRLSEVRDDANNGATVIGVEHALDGIANFAILRDQWSASVKRGINLRAGETFTWKDFAQYNVGGVFTINKETANPLTVKVGAGLALYEVEAGRYSLSEFINILSRWLDGETGAGRLNFYYVFNVESGGANGTRVFVEQYIDYNYATPGGVAYGFDGELTSSAARMLGFESRQLRGRQSTEGFERTYATKPPLQTVLPRDPGTIAGGVPLEIEGARGTFIEQSGMLPAASGPTPQEFATDSVGWGVFAVNNAALILARRDSDELLEHVNVLTPSTLQRASSSQLFYEDWLQDAEAGEEITLTQILLLEGTFAELFAGILASTDSFGYNGALDFGVQMLGIPAGLLGVSFTESLNALHGASLGAIVAIKKTTKLADVFGADLMLRRANLVWKNQSLRVASWSTPSKFNALHNLTEDNKAEPSTSRVSNRSATALTDQWRHDVIKLEYARNVATDNYERTISFEDRTSVDDAGGNARPLTISARNCYVQASGNIEVLFPHFYAFMPFFSRPIRLLTRAIDLRYFENVAAGDTVALTDAFARDPITGARGVAQRSGVIVSHRYSIGGARPGGDVDPISGEVTIALIDLDRVAPYCPTARVDETVGTGGFIAGYNSGTLTLRTKIHEYSESTEPYDASHFQSGDKVFIVEIDPVNPAAPDSWTRNVTSVSSTDIVISASLSAPAWSSTKKYKIYSQGYAAAQATQRTDAYQAGNNGRIASLASARQYALAQPAGSFTTASYAEVCERVATATAGDGAALDVGADVALARNTNWLLDHGTVRQSPALSNSVLTNTVGGFKAVLHSAIFINSATLPANVIRKLYVAPFMRSTDGSSAQCRVTLMRAPTVSNSFYDVTRMAPYAEATFTTTSTTWGTATEQGLDLAGIPNGDGLAWLLVEINTKCETRGLGQCVERWRE